MADNITLNSGSGGAAIKTDDDGTAHWQYVKVAYGADNTQNIVTSTATNPLPVALSDTDNTVLDSIQTAVELIDNAVSGAGFNITQIGGAAAPIGAGIEATALRVTLATDSTGVVSIDDNGGSLTVDNAALSVVGGGVEAAALRVTLASDSTGVLSIDDNGGSITVDGAVATTNAGTFAVQEDGAALTALQLIDNTVYVEDVATPATISGNAIVMERDDALSTLTPIEGDWVSLRSSAEGALWTQEFNSDAILALLTTIDSDTSNLAVVGGGTEAAAIRVTLANDSTGLVSVDDGGGSITVDGTVGVSGTVTVDLGANNDVVAAGDVAHDAVDSGNPLKIGAKATNSVEGQTQVAANDRTNLLADLNGVLLARPHTTLEEVLSDRVADTAGTSAAFTNLAAGGAGVHNYVTTFIVYNSSATDGYVDIRDGTAGSVIMTLPAPATGGSVINLPVPLKQTTANTALAYDVSGALTTVYITAVGFQAQG